jgi:hypothetical protein
MKIAVVAVVAAVVVVVVAVAVAVVVSWLTVRDWASHRLLLRKGGRKPCLLIIIRVESRHFEG